MKKENKKPTLDSRVEMAIPRSNLGNKKSGSTSDGSRKIGAEGERPRVIWERE